MRVVLFVSHNIYTSYNLGYIYFVLVLQLLVEFFTCSAWLHTINYMAERGGGPGSKDPVMSEWLAISFSLSLRD